ncbi:MAG: SNF2 helicase associated domain-containing protein [Clostridiales bacterium]|nr:SNF2 helicase associated domain-containing protein [Clostridiales bacterium]
MDMRVEDISFDSYKNSVSGNVQGNKLYETSVIFDKSGDASGFRCNCPYKGLCKHVVALMLETVDRDKEGEFDEEDFKKDIKEDLPVTSIFDIFEHSDEEIKSQVNLEVTITIDSTLPQDNPESHKLSLRTGLDRMYIVKNIREFAKNVIDRQPMDFGKKFNYDPDTHDYAPKDIKLITYLNELDRTESYIHKAWGYYNNKSHFKGKEVSLPQHTVKNILELYIDREINLNFEDITTVATIIEKDIPIDFNLRKSDNDFILDVKVPNESIALETSLTYIMSDSIIYKNSSEHSKKIRPFLLSLFNQKGSELTFKDQDRERFVSEILPHTEGIGEIHIDDEVSSSIIKLPLQAEVYLDKKDSVYTADVKFIYGERTINPFAPIDELSKNSETVLLRDSVKENAILNIFNTTDFRVLDNRLYLNNDDSLFEFVSSHIPMIQKHAQIYYSDVFKNIKVKNIMAMKGAVRLSEDTNLLEFEFDIDGIDLAELRHIFNSLKEKKRFYRLKDGGFLDLESDNVINMADFIGSLSLNAKDIENGKITIPNYRAIYLDQNIRESDHVKIKRNHYFKELVQNITEPQDMHFVLPEELDNVLRDYQKFGFKWLKTLSHYGMGGVLADDMGLGKTLQVLSYILSEKSPEQKPAIIVVPTSLVYNWEAEIQKFTPKLTNIIIAGTKEEREEKIKQINNYDIAITSYPLMRRDIDLYDDMIFSTCIIDEAQHIKNHLSLNAKSVKKIKAKTRFALTGTPMENNLSELWSIFDFTMHGYLFSHSKFVKNYEKPIVKDADKNAMHDLSKHIKPFILRRMKKDVLQELPEKIENKMVSELTEDQKKVYLAWMQKLKGEISNEINEVGFNKSHIKILAGLTRLRQICCHPSLFLEDYDKESGKLLQLEEVISDAMDGGHRILVFSQFTSMLKIIKKSLEKEKISYFYLDGSTKMKDRGTMVNLFNDGEADVFLISLKAGGLGLNLTGADTVIHYDPWWNPAVEDQATDRAYRIGQDKVVQVIKLITAGTIEEKIYSLQQRKKALIDSVIQPGQTLITKLTKQDVEDLFAL